MTDTYIPSEEPTIAAIDPSDGSLVTMGPVEFSALLTRFSQIGAVISTLENMISANNEQDRYHKVETTPLAVQIAYYEGMRDAATFVASGQMPEVMLGGAV